MKSIKVQRCIAALLAITGSVFALAALVMPLLWLGYVVWGGWVAVAFGAKRWQEKWFWIVSAGWNAISLAALMMNNHFIGKDVIFWYPIGHVTLAALLSLYLSVRVPWDTRPENRRA